jgi:hypothetical protein
MVTFAFLDLVITAEINPNGPSVIASGDDLATFVTDKFPPLSSEIIRFAERLTRFQGGRINNVGDVHIVVGDLRG